MTVLISENEVLYTSRKGTQKGDHQPWSRALESYFNHPTLRDVVCAQRLAQFVDERLYPKYELLTTVLACIQNRDLKSEDLSLSNAAFQAPTFPNFHLNASTLDGFLYQRAIPPILWKGLAGIQDPQHYENFMHELRLQREQEQKDVSKNPDLQRWFAITSGLVMLDPNVQRRSDGIWATAAGLAKILRGAKGTKKMTFVDGTAVAPALGSMECLDGKQLDGMGPNNWYILKPDAVSGGADYCDQTKCPLRGKCIRNAVLSESKPIGLPTVSANWQATLHHHIPRAFIR